MRRLVLASLFSAALTAPSRLAAQDSGAPTPAPTPAPAQKEEPIPYRPIEGPVIINLPSVDVPKRGTLTLLFAHRFQTQVQGSTINDLFSFDDGANIGIGLGYAPIDRFALSFYRYSNFNKTYEVSGKFALLCNGPFAVSLGAGGDFRTVPDREQPPPPSTVTFPPYTNRSTFFAQAILAYTPFPWLRVTAEPMYLNHTSGQLTGQPFPYAVAKSNGTTAYTVSPAPFYANVFNVPLAVSVALTHSITVHGEVIPSYSFTAGVNHYDCGGPCPTVSEKVSPGVAWIVSVEKTLLRHRFAFTAGNMKETTVDQYLMPYGNGFPRNIYLGFTLSRQWPLIQ